MPHALVEKYVDERDNLLNTIQVLKNATYDRGGDPSEQDLKLMQDSYERIDKLDGMIKVLGEDRTMDEATREKLMAPVAPSAASQPKYRSGGEMLWDCIHANYGNQHSSEDTDARRRWEGVMKRAAQHMGYSAADTTPVAGGLGSLQVVPVVGPVIDFYPSAQPFLSGIGRRPAPNSLTFTRPRIVDPDYAGTGAAPQGLEKAELVSKKFDIKVDTLTLVTIGGYLNVSQQLMSLAPSGWDIIVAQLQKRVAYSGEAAAITELRKTASKVTLAAGANSAAVLSALYDAAAMVYSKTRAQPTWLAYGPSGWAMLGKLVDGAGRPLFPFLGATNAMGQASLGDMTNLGPLGLTQIVSPAITTTDLFMGNQFGIEAYVYSFPVLEAPEPALLGRQVAVAEAYAFYRPTTNEAGPSGDGAVLIGP